MNSSLNTFLLNFKRPWYYRFKINNFRKHKDMCIDGWIEESISDTKAYNKREHGKLLKGVKKKDQF